MNRQFKLMVWLFAMTTAFGTSTFSQDFMLQGWYWDYPQFVDGKSYAAHLKGLSPELNNAGFTYVWAPPMSAASFGSSSVGYDVQDYFDLGNFNGRTRLGNRSEVDDMIQTLSLNGISVVADMIYNHRDGGNMEDNPAVEGWIENMTAIKIDAGDQPFPSDRYLCYLPVGGTSGNGAGNYYFKIRSASEHSNFYGKKYTAMIWTNKVNANYGHPPLNESEPNGGGDCGEAFNAYELGRRMVAFIDNSGCKTDEFELTLDVSDFNAAGDTLWIRMYNEGGLGDMTDHFIYGLWNGGIATDVQSQIGYRTYTNFEQQPSGRGGMNWANFKPNGNPTQLSGDLDAMLFFYDIDHNIQSTRDTLFEWTRWMLEDVGVGGIRVDAVKHFEASFMGDLLDYLFDHGLSPSLVIGESFDFDAGVLKNWTDDVQNNMDSDTKSAIDVRVFDFALRNNLEQACDGFGYDVRNLFSSGIVDGSGGSGFNVATFVNNHDFRDPGQPIDEDPELAYAYILTNNRLGVPTIFYPDYFAPGNQKFAINGLMKVHREYIFGADQVDYLSRFSTPYSSNYISGFDNTTLIYQISNGVGGREVVIAINFAGTSLKVDHGINMTNLAQGDTMTDIFSASAFSHAIVSNSNEIYMELPPRSFGIWIQGDLSDKLISIEDTTITSIPSPDQSTNNEVSLSPNPSSSGFQLRIESDNSRNASCRIVNVNGDTVAEMPLLLTAGMNRLDIEALDLPGIYLLQVEIETNYFTKRLIQLR